MADVDNVRESQLGDDYLILFHKENTRLNENSGQKGDNSSVVCDIKDGSSLDFPKQDKAVISIEEHANNDVGMQQLSISDNHPQQQVEGDQKCCMVDEQSAAEPLDSASIQTDIHRDLSRDYIYNHSISANYVSTAENIKKGYNSAQLNKDSTGLPERPKSEKLVSGNSEANVPSNIMTTSFGKV